MSPDPGPFRWVSPESGILGPRGGESSPGASADVVDWFLARWGQGLSAPLNTPLGRVLDRARRVAAGGPVEVETSELRAGLREVFLLRILDWSIRALHGRAGLLADVHRSFLTKELLGADLVDATASMPRGIGTLWLSARLLQSSGGRMWIRGEGHGGAGHDIRWEPRVGGVALIERKDRAWAVGDPEPVQARARYVARKVLEAGPAFPYGQGARVLAVGFPGFVEPEREHEIRAEVGAVIRDVLGADPTPEATPDFLIIEFLGSQLDADERVRSTHFTEVIDLGHDRPEWKAVAPAFLRAFTVQGSVEHPEPWPIQFE